MNYFTMITTKKKALMRIKPAHNGKRMDVLLAATLPTELYKLTPNGFQNHT